MAGDKLVMQCRLRATKEVEINTALWASYLGITLLSKLTTFLLNHVLLSFYLSGLV